MYTYIYNFFLPYCYPFCQREFASELLGMQGRQNWGAAVSTSLGSVNTHPCPPRGLVWACRRDRSVCWLPAHCWPGSPESGKRDPSLRMTHLSIHICHTLFRWALWLPLTPFSEPRQWIPGKNKKQNKTNKQTKPTKTQKPKTSFREPRWWYWMSFRERGPGNCLIREGGISCDLWIIYLAKIIFEFYSVTIVLDFSCCLQFYCAAQYFFI